MKLNSELQEKIISILKECNISAYTDIASISLKKSSILAEKLKNFMLLIDFSNDAIVSSMGKTTITLILPEKLMDNAKNYFSNEIVDLNMKAGAIFMKCPKEVNSTPGVTTFISSMFSDKNVSIYDLIASYTDYVIVINEKETYKMASYIKKVLGC
jgi:aspartokinase